MAIDPRLELARRMAGTSGGGSDIKSRAAAQYAALKNRKKELGGDQGGTDQGGPGGWQGVVSAALDNPIAKTALKPLSMLDLGRSSVVSGLKEITDAVDFNPNTKASLSEFGQQAREHIGVGDVIQTGNKWIDRAIGFAGDVAFDPLTYLTLGTGHLAGLAGRTSLAADLALKGSAKVAANEITQTALEELVQRAGKRGLGKLTAAERASFGLPKAGIYFGAPLAKEAGKGVYLGGEKFAQGLGSGIASLKGGFMGSRALEPVTMTREGLLRKAPTGLEDIYTKLATGRGDISATQAATMLGGITEKSSIGNEFAGTWARVADSLLKDIKTPENLVRLTHDLESGVSNVVTGSFRKLFDDIRTAWITETGKDIGNVENFVPHQWTDFGRKLLGSKDSELGKELRKVLKITVDEVQQAGPSFERKVVPGSYKIMGKDITFKTGTIKEIGDVLKKNFPDVVTEPVLENDFRKIIGRYVDQMGRGVGDAALEKRLYETGIATGRPDAMHLVSDVAGTKAANEVMVEELKTTIDGGKKALALAKTDAKVSVKAALDSVGNTLKMKVSQLRNADNTLISKWEKLSSQLANDAISFDSKMALLNAAELEGRDQLEQAVLLSQKLRARIEEEIAQNGVDEKLLDKVRLANRKEAKKAVDAAESNVLHLQAQMEAYESMGKTVSTLKEQLKEYTGSMKPSDLPEGAQKAARFRTVSKQAALDTSGSAGNEVVDQVVRMGTSGNISSGFMKRLKVDGKAAGSALRQTIDIAGNVMDKRFHEAVVSVKEMIDQYYSGIATIPEAQLASETQRVEKLAMQLGVARNKLNAAVERKAKGLGAEKTAEGLFIAGTSTSDATINKLEGAVRNLEANVKSASDSLAVLMDESARGIKSGFKYDPNLPGLAAEQASRKLDSEIKKVVDSVVATYSTEVSALAGVRQGEMTTALFNALKAQSEVGSRPSGAAYLSAAQMNLEKTITDARVATDFGRRFNAVMGEMANAGRPVSEAQNLMIQDMVMREVLASEKRALQTSRDELVSSLEHYAASSNVPKSVNMQQTKAFKLAEKDARTTWGWLQPYIEEIQNITSDLRQGGMGASGVMTGSSADILASSAEELGNAGFSVVNRSMWGEARAMHTQAVRDLRESMLLAIFPDDKVARAAYAKTTDFDRLLRRISGDLGPKAERAWVDEIVRIRAEAFRPTEAKGVASSRNWYAVSAQAADKQLEVMRVQIDDLTKKIDGLRPVSALKPSDPTNKATIAFFDSEAARYREQLIQLRRSGTRMGAEHDRIKGYVEMFSEAANIRRTAGRPTSGAKFSAKSILGGESSKAVGVANREAQTIRTQLIALEAEMENILSSGALATSVKEVAGKESIFNKAKMYIDNIDRDLGIIAQRNKGLPAEAKKESAAYAAKLRAERKTLVEAIDKATPLEDRVISAKVVLEEKKQAVKDLTGKTAQQAEIAGRTARLRVSADAVASGQTIRGTTMAANIAKTEAERATYREVYDATIPAVRDSMNTIETSRANIEAALPAIEEQVRKLPKAGKADTVEKLTVLHNYIGDSYDLLDPQGLAQRLLDRPADLTPDMLKPGAVLNLGVSNPELAVFLQSLPDDPAAKAALALIYKAHDDMGKLLALMDEKSNLQAQLKLAKSNELVDVMTMVVKDGFDELANSGLFVPQEVTQAMQRLVTLNAENKYAFIQALNDYTDIWKAVKTTSPRFHIRNAMSATFMNFVADVSFSNMKLGIKYWQMFEADPVNWLSKVPKEYRVAAQNALQDVFGSGGGEYSQVASKGSKAPTKGIFRLSKNAGGRVEGSVRMGMALDSRLSVELGGKGFGRDLSVGRISKYHFNYSQLSQFDKNAKALIPFWTFMSRNMPLQVEQMWLNPKAYAVYNSAVRNLRAEEPGDITPQYITEIGGFKLPGEGNFYGTPDIGMNRVEQDIAQLRDPMRLAQNLNPVLKTGLELAMGRQFYKDIPIDQGYVPLEGASRLAEIPLRAFGMVEESSGRPVIKGSTQYGLNALIPGMQEYNRFIDPNTESAKQKQGQNLLSFFTGAPITKVTESQIKSERDRVARDKAKALAKRKAIAKAANK